jgi:hypothetical protein
MYEFFRKILDAADFMPHRHCYLLETGVMWLHVASDILIALAYYSIPLQLLYFIRKRRDLPFPWIFALFGVFIVACGTTHVMDVYTLWTPIYRAAGVLKVFTAAVSLMTAGLLFPLIPQALRLASPAQLLKANRWRRRLRGASKWRMPCGKAKRIWPRRTANWTRKCANGRPISFQPMSSSRRVSRRCG